MTVTAHSLYALAWLSFGLVHSLLAGPQAKARLHFVFGRGYRLAYNLFALFHIGLVIYGMRYWLGADLGPYHFSATVQSMLNGIRLLGVVIILAALSQYDLGRFAGITQLFVRAEDDAGEALHVSGLHRYVRHPLYTGAHLYFWGSVGSEFDLATALWASSYFIIGSYFEEQKLIADYGAAYRAYRARVPSVVPWRGRAI